MTCRRPRGLQCSPNPRHGTAPDFGVTVGERTQMSSDSTQHTQTGRGGAWAEAVGACFTEASFRRRTGLTKYGLRAAAAENRVLELVTADGIRVYPAFQLRERHLISGISPVICELQRATNDPWEWAVLLNATVQRIENGKHVSVRHIDRLARGDVDAVVLEARRTAWAWSS